MPSRRSFLTATGAGTIGVAAGATKLEIAQNKALFTDYVTCSDSRVSPELLFGRGLGELFIIRNAGNTVTGWRLAASNMQSPSLECR